MIYGRPRRRNPELLSVYNPPSRGARMSVRRVKASNYPLTIMYRGKRYTFRELRDQFGAKKAAVIWRKQSVFGHGRNVLRLVGTLSRRHKEKVTSRRRKKSAKKAKKRTARKKKRTSTRKKIRKTPKRKSTKKKRKAPRKKAKGRKQRKAAKSLRGKFRSKKRKAANPRRRTRRKSRRGKSRRKR